MRMMALAFLVALFVASGPSLGAPPVDELDAHVTAWATSMADTSSFAGKFTLTRIEPAFRKETKYTGSVAVMKPNLARLGLTPESQPAEGEVYLCTGASVYEYSFSRKSVTEHPVAVPKPGDNLLLDLLRGLDAAALKKRFEITLVGQNANHVKLKLLPKDEQDRREFKELSVALFAPTTRLPYVLGGVYLRKQNDEQETWVFNPDSIRINPKDVTKENTFRFEKAPAGWTFQRASVPARP